MSTCWNLISALRPDLNLPLLSPSESSLLRHSQASSSRRDRRLQSQEVSVGKELEKDYAPLCRGMYVHCCHIPHHSLASLPEQPGLCHGTQSFIE